MSGQREVFAYGHPEFGGICLGGENAGGSFSLEQWDFSDGDETYDLVLDFVVHGSSATAFASHLEALASALARSSGNVGLTTGIKTTRTVTSSLASRLLTLTRTAGDAFTTADLGLPITINGQGSYQVTEFVDGDTVRALIPTGLTLPTTAAGQTATVGHLHFGGVDGAKREVFLARAEYDRAPDGDDDALRRKFRLTLRLGKPASATRAAAFGNRQRGRYTVSVDGAGLRRVSFEGVYTAGDERGALANYQLAGSGFQAWVTTVTASLGGGPFEIEGQDSYALDDEGSLLSFTATRRELNFPDLSGSVDSTLVSGAQVRFTRSLDLVHGLPGIAKPYTLQVTYSALVDSEQTTYDEILALWRSQIKGHLIAEAEGIFGTVLVVLNEQGPLIDATGNRINASMSCLISGSGSNIYQYRKQITYDHDLRKTDDTTHDGLPNTYASYTPGARTTAQVRVTITRLGQPQQASGGASAGGFGFGGISGGTNFTTGIFGNASGPLQFDQEAPGGGGDDKAKGPEHWPEPGDPSLALELDVGAGVWDPRRRVVVISPEFWGHDPDGAGQSIDVSFSVYVQDFLWVNTSASVTDPPRPTTPGGSSGGKIQSVDPQAFSEGAEGRIASQAR